MKPIKIPKYRKIRRRIISFKKMNLLEIEENSLVDLINISFTIPTGLFPQQPNGKSIYRACINEDLDGNFIKEPFVDKERIAYNPTPTKYGRCNLINNPVFYGADGLDVAVMESCNNTLNRKTQELYLTVGEWTLTKKLQVAIVCHSRRAHKRSGDLLVGYQSLSRMVKSKSTSKSEYLIWRLKNRFFSDEFAKNVYDGNEKEYLFSALYTNVVLNTTDEKLKASGLWYPSVAYKLYGHNVAYSSELVNNGTLILTAVKHVKCTFVSKKKKPKIEIITEVVNIQNEKINWK